MKRIEFIAPVEAMRGNLSGAQDLRYAENDNKAYEGPVGSVNYARNYSPRFIGAKIAKSGKKYFTVRTKSASHLTTRAKKAMALLGGVGALYGAIVSNKSSQLYQQLYAQWLKFVEHGSTNTFRQSLSGAIRTALESGAANVTYAGPNGVIQFKNPWYDGSMTQNAMVSQAILVKFWTELAPNGIVFSVDERKGVAVNGESFQMLIEEDVHNILGLTQQVVGSNTYIKLGSLWVTEDGEYSTNGDEIQPIVYGLTDVTPTE